MPTQEKAHDNGRILFYVAFVLLLIAGVFASDLIKRIVHEGWSSAPSNSAVTARADKDEDEDFEDETASRSMTG